jgi:hypothetical protein
MQPHMRYELTLTRWPLYPPDIVHARQARAKPTVYAKDLASDDGSDRERVEDVDKGLPRLDVGTAFTLVVEPVDYVRGRANRTMSVSTRLETRRAYWDSPRVTFAHSWLPRSKKKFSGYLIL